MLYSTYAHQTEFYQSAAKFAIVKVDSPIQPAVLDNGPAADETHEETWA